MNNRILMEEVLTLLLYGFDLLAMPGFRKWNQSYEGWLFQNGLLHRMHYLEKQKFLLREGKKSAWVYHLTEKGRATVLGGRDPEPYWQRRWDGWWRQIIFDLPVSQQKVRTKLIRWLRRNGFGYLQDSVWISPDPVKEIATAMKGFAADAEAFTILESRCARGFSDATLVTGAWTFAKINEGYSAYERFAGTAMRRLHREQLHPRDLFILLRDERERWLAGFELDPLLPVTLWPKEYGGRRAWNARSELLKTLSVQLPQP